jgi:hypothetical protein
MKSGKLTSLEKSGSGWSDRLKRERCETAQVLLFVADKQRAHNVPTAIRRRVLDRNASTGAGMHGCPIQIVETIQLLGRGHRIRDGRQWSGCMRRKMAAGYLLWRHWSMMSTVMRRSNVPWMMTLLPRMMMW